jgi:hypothetical protein
MEHRLKIPALALLGLSLTDCTGRDSPDDPIIGDWRAIQVDGEKHPVSFSYYEAVNLRGEQLRIEADLAGEMAVYQVADYDGYNHDFELTAELVVDASGASKYRIEVAHDFFDYYDTGYDSGYPDTGYADTGYADTGDAETGGYAIPNDHEPVHLRPLAAPTSPDLAPGDLVFDCTLEQDTLTCDREGADALKHWVFSRLKPDGT